MNHDAFSPDLASALERKAISHGTAVFLSGLGPSYRAPLIDLFTAIQLSVSRQREIAEWVHDIAQREETTVAEALSALDVPALLADEKINVPQKAAHLRSRVFARRFPQLDACLAGVKERLRKIDMPHGASIAAMSPLEDREFKLEIVFSSSDEIVRIIDGLRAMVNSWEFADFSDYLASGRSG
ncbi:MAG: hypothetical protein A2268_16060 [Candidatus Raymondbacteria bacterium RifOxyA12_full_50_37]|uniref:Uncharacterized protein n=1 Tax=Candidatus Raymondbacteria bacterium RIFOXYD12_FULL_49_13 TaxID=1817890 RepID=A0A1F7FCA7_UNCRA|nr:MAG: hypothetical protein A2268_16060 [Candidatus Raymondbacteria bacterium RifOxyA12_full_50_37]OGJ92438.1 MAG: hypothetical protein A2248_11550 [Candidatus Raymondbacteria bacterium RIFOXYA2_FULL_49_16]OGJ94497.1 MAG: hypothetical protein A2350_07870 [Candidatus Raymondbacteria bacterium RifOxyB12_full_50_8]OGJ95257.1 MAG: hypothetical protein A2453_05680 [Candidatus Raymondbacteria bacterium RIFOXYC2_FULL_50_21]OGK04096.1 MAG: hypothetical protein A2519_19525 [Candidatus Raymondbacteria b